MAGFTVNGGSGRRGPYPRSDQDIIVPPETAIAVELAKYP